MSNFVDGIAQPTTADCSVASEDRGYFYDSAWNLNRRSNNGATQVFQVDNKNQLTNAIGQQLVYDYNGNVTSSSAGHNTYAYDDENRLVAWCYYQVSASQQQNGDLRTEFVYDATGRLRKRREYQWYHEETVPENSPGRGAEIVPMMPIYWQLVAETRYLYDGNRVIQERDGNSVPTVSYTRGTDLSGSLEGAGGIGGLLARSAGYTGGNWTSHAYYHADGNGNITYLVNSNRTLGASYRYDPFGNLISKSGTLADANLYRFSSKELHVNSGLCYYLYRFYSPSWQRWINRDPLGDEGSTAALTGPAAPVRQQGRQLSAILTGVGSWSEDLNQYCAVANSPLNEIDPLGLLLGFGYGNWCGWSRSGQKGGPIDEVDFACMIHDHCLSTWRDACSSFKVCNQIFCSMVLGADCAKSANPKACRKARRTILAACLVISPILRP